MIGPYKCCYFNVIQNTTTNTSVMAHKNNGFKIVVLYLACQLQHPSLRNFFILFIFIFHNFKISYRNYNWINNLFCKSYTNTFIEIYYLYLKSFHVFMK